MSTIPKPILHTSLSLCALYVEFPELCMRKINGGINECGIYNRDLDMGTGEQM
jgi:hypothetical protein